MLGLNQNPAEKSTTPSRENKAEKRVFLKTLSELDALALKNIWENTQRPRSVEDWADFYEIIAGEKVYGRLPAETEPKELTYSEFKNLVANTPHTPGDDPFMVTAVDMLLKKFDPNAPRNKKEGKETQAFQDRILKSNRRPGDWIQLYEALAGWPIFKGVAEDAFPDLEEKMSVEEFDAQYGQWMLQQPMDFEESSIKTKDVKFSTYPMLSHVLRNRPGRPNRAYKI